MGTKLKKVYAYRGFDFDTVIELFTEPYIHTVTVTGKNYCKSYQVENKDLAGEILTIFLDTKRYVDNPPTPREAEIIDILEEIGFQKEE